MTQIMIIQRCTYCVQLCINRLVVQRADFRIPFAGRTTSDVHSSNSRSRSHWNYAACVILLDHRRASTNTPAVNHRFLNNRSIKPRVELRRPNAETITTRHESISSNNNSSRRRSDESYSYSNAYASGKTHDEVRVLIRAWCLLCSYSNSDRHPTAWIKPRYLGHQRTMKACYEPRVNFTLLYNLRIRDEQFTTLYYGHFCVLFVDLTWITLSYLLTNIIDIIMP